MASDYILQVGEQGKARLELLNDLLNPLSQRFLKAAGLCEGMHVLEVGCGTGAMTAWLARCVGPKGKVTALDVSQEQIDIARETVGAAALQNVDFHCTDIEEDSVPADGADLAYCRLLLIHLKSPQDALVALADAVKPGGVVACEEQVVEFQTYPQTDLWDRVCKLYVALSDKTGVDPHYGRRLAADIVRIGLTTTSRSFSEAMISREQALTYCSLVLAELRPGLLAHGLISEEEMTEVERKTSSDRYVNIDYSTFLRMAQVAATK